MSSADRTKQVGVASTADGKRSVWVDLAPHFFAAAARMARDAHKLPEPPPNTPDDPRWSYVLGGVLTACSGTEAYANEIFLSAVAGGDRFHPFSGDTEHAVRLLWPELEKLTALDKLDRALQLACKTPFDRGAEPFQSAALAFKLRNALVHYKARDKDAPVPGETRNLASALRKRFHVPPYADDPDGHFPYGFLTHACVEWVVNSQLDLVRLYRDKTGGVYIEVEGLDYSTR